MAAVANARHILRGLATYAPGASRLTQTRTGGSSSALYCYAVWMRHFVLAHNAGLCATTPARIGELGPGDSLGVGLAALLSGARTYVGLDVKRFSTVQKNRQILDELIELFQERADIPAPDLLPRVKPYLADHGFPEHLLTSTAMAANLAQARLQSLRDALSGGENACIRYETPWSETSVAPGALDMIIAQAVMEYVPDLERTYQTMAAWLAPGGFISVQVDLKCHGCASEWNGHYAYSDRVWELIKGKRGFYLNRQPFSKHMAAIGAAGLEAVCVKPLRRKSRLRVQDLAPAFRDMSHEDLVTAGAFILARRPV